MTSIIFLNPIFFFFFFSISFGKVHLFNKIDAEGIEGKGSEIMACSIF
jgi:hypothetical protein